MRYPVKGKGGQNQSWFTLIELKVALEQEAHRLSHEVGMRARTTRGPRVFDVAHVINCALSDYLTQSREERDRRAGRGQVIFEKLQDQDRPAYFSPEGSSEEPGHSGSAARRKGAVGHKGLPGYMRRPVDGGQRPDAVAVTDDRPLGKI